LPHFSTYSKQKDFRIPISSTPFGEPSALMQLLGTFSKIPPERQGGFPGAPAN
jgi:hypothetical protein